jgi:hypothetical protein
MTDYIKKMPAAVGIIFFSVAACTSLFVGAEILTAIYRGFIAGVASALFAGPLAYVLFEEEIPEPTAPEGLEHIAEKFKRKS